MCEFKIIKQNDGSQILEDIVILSYTESNELLFKDILGIGETIDSGIILEVNTLNQTCLVFQHPLIKEFIDLILSLDAQKGSKAKIEGFIKELEDLKEQL